MGIDDVTRDHVLQTLAEYDDLSREVFLSTYGFKPARSYLILHDGRRYDSKAIVGVAHRHVNGHALGPGDFSGGAATVVPVLTRLGFHVEGPRAEKASADSSFATRLLISPAFGSAESRRHWKDTLDRLVPFTESQFAERLTDDQLGRLKEFHPDGKARFWGATPGHDGKMAAVRTGDVVLFTGKNHVRAIGEIGAIFRNSSFADVMWPPKQGGESWHTVYSLRQFGPAEIPYATLSALLDYRSTFMYPGQLVLSGERARAGIDGLLITTRTALEEAGAVALPDTVSELPVERQHTRSTTVERAAQKVLFNREESALVIEFCRTLTDTTATRFASAAGICDIFLNGPEGSELIEAKSRVERSYVREALAQLLDYARYAPDAVGRLAALFPQALDPKERHLLHHYGIDVIHRVSPGAFERVPAPNQAREQMRSMWESRELSH
ncbi:hypothetical protein [Streptomyces sp. 35G-GA-8]|uniref:hypothetical protein n=1 Tax=Streptomyces sp. 35G-GA-8 TaxID=2939434 RepID=UPI00201E9920|nr:hypothetical protein [Streptomyces sp. 35G-GA-8]MCL7380099.1 hypothetical protein [Streptomyces sp. 35G-GA-8]